MTALHAAVCNLSKLPGRQLGAGPLLSQTEVDL